MSISIPGSALLLLAIAVYAQDPRGSIGGRVVDRSDAIIIGAKVAATNSQTGVSASVRTNESGSFRIPFLLPGIYRLTAEMPGFKTSSQDNVQLRIADSLDLTVHLDIGETSGRVEVHAATPLLETGNDRSARSSTSAGCSSFRRKAETRSS